MIFFKHSRAAISNAQKKNLNFLSFGRIFFQIIKRACQTLFKNFDFVNCKIITFGVKI